MNNKADKKTKHRFGRRDCKPLFVDRMTRFVYGNGGSVDRSRKQKRFDDI